MFIHDLKPKEKLAFLSLARDLIQCDGEITEKEKPAIDRICLEMGVSPDTKPPFSSRKIAFESIRRREARCKVMLELIGLAYVNGTFPAKEKGLIRSAAKAWKLTNAEVVEMTDWVHSLFGLYHEASTFWTRRR